mgnify:CR=1 FL=1
MAKKKLEIRDKTIFDGVIVKYILKFMFMVWFKLTGWRPTDLKPEGAGITIAAPHTSNWDVVYAMGAAILIDVKMYFSIKDSWCRIPIIGPLMLWMGGIPIDRSSKGTGQVDLIKDFVEKHKGSRIYFLFTHEGTRGKVNRWKTGFYHVAKDCGLPIFLAQVDYRNKVSGVFHTYKLTDDKQKDIAAIQASYESVYAKFPETQYPHYTGPIPEISDREARVMKAMYTLKEAATQAEIAAKARFEELTTEMLDFLVEKGVLEFVDNFVDGEMVRSYRLTLAGNGCLLHVTPSLA